MSALERLARSKGKALRAKIAKQGMLQALEAGDWIGASDASMRPGGMVCGAGWRLRGPRGEQSEGSSQERWDGSGGSAVAEAIALGKLLEEFERIAPSSSRLIAWIDCEPLALAMEKGHGALWDRAGEAAARLKAQGRLTARWAPREAIASINERARASAGLRPEKAGLPSARSPL